MPEVRGQKVILNHMMMLNMSSYVFLKCFLD